MVDTVRLRNLLARAEAQWQTARLKEPHAILNDLCELADEARALLDALDEAEKALRRIASFGSQYGVSEEAEIARAALDRIGEK